jgi:hypothetical protein
MMFSIENFSPQSKVWVYQSSRPLTSPEIAALNTKLSVFAVQWTAHNKQLNAMGKVIEDRFILLIVDETHTMASGCSIDTSVHFIKSLENEFQINLFDRTIVNYVSGDTIKSTTINQLNDLFSNGEITSQSIVFDPLVNTLSAFNNEFKIPVSQTWMKNFI